MSQEQKTFGQAASAETGSELDAELLEGVSGGAILFADPPQAPNPEPTSPSGGGSQGGSSGSNNGPGGSPPPPTPTSPNRGAF